MDIEVFEWRPLQP